MDKKYELEQKFKNYILDNVVKGYEMEFKTVNPEMLESLAAHCSSLSKDFSALENEHGKAPELFLLMKAIVENPNLDWNEKYDFVFSEHISKQIFKALPELSYYDSDSGYEDDVLAFYHAVKNELNLD